MLGRLMCCVVVQEVPKPRSFLPAPSTPGEVEHLALQPVAIHTKNTAQVSRAVVVVESGGFLCCAFEATAAQWTAVALGSQNGLAYRRDLSSGDASHSSSLYLAQQVGQVNG